MYVARFSSFVLGTTLLGVYAVKPSEELDNVESSSGENMFSPAMLALGIVLLSSVTYLACNIFRSQASSSKEKVPNLEPEPLKTDPNILKKPGYDIVDAIIEKGVKGGAEALKAGVKVIPTAAPAIITSSVQASALSSGPVGSIVKPVIHGAIDKSVMSTANYAAKKLSDKIDGSVEPITESSKKHSHKSINTSVDSIGSSWKKI